MPFYVLNVITVTQLYTFIGHIFNYDIKSQAVSDQTFRLFFSLTIFLSHRQHAHWLVIMIYKKKEFLLFNTIQNNLVNS